MGHYDDDAIAGRTDPAACRRCAGGERPPIGGGHGHAARAWRRRYAQLARVRAPAGARRAGAQEEIALHALAEVVALRHERIIANPVPAPEAIVGFAVDPVCGMTVDTNDAAHTAVHDGQTYFFCCSGCREQFVADAARFLRAAAG